MNTYTKKINDTEYTVTLFNATKGLNIARKLGSMSLDRSTAIDRLMEYDSDLTLSMELLSNTLVDGEPVELSNFNRLFSGKLDNYLEILAFIIETNFKPFFYTVVNLMKKREEAEAEADTLKQKSL